VSDFKKWRQISGDVFQNPTKIKAVSIKALSVMTSSEEEERVLQMISDVSVFTRDSSSFNFNLLIALTNLGRGNSTDLKQYLKVQ
jgi:hypothetical protein